MIDKLLGDQDTGTWLDHRHPEYTRNYRKWKYTMDHYSGDVLDNLDIYLHKRSSGESDQAYQERKKVTNYLTHFPAIIESLAGVMSTVDVKTERSFGDLGDYKDRSSIAGMLWVDANTNGDSWPNVFRKLSIHLMLTQTQWILVNPLRDKTPTVNIISPLSVVNWLEVDGTIVQALMKNKVDARLSIEDDPTTTDEYVLYTLDGWTKYRVVNSEPVIVETGGYEYVDQSGNRVLPLFRSELPLSRQVGYMGARSYNSIWNNASLRNFLIRASSTPFMVVGMDDEAFEKTKEELGKGGRLINEGTEPNANTRFIAPSTSPADISDKIIRQETEELYISMFRDYGDSAVEKTATEVSQNVSTGIGAFLNLLKTAIDEAETRAINLVTQQQGIVSFDAYVSRTDDFKPFNIDREMDNLRERFWGPGGTVPIGRDAEVDAASKIAEWSGVKADRAQIEEDVDRRRTPGDV